MQKFLNLRLLLVIIFIVNAAFNQGQAQQLRYFMQAEASPANAIPYGNNPKAGHYLKTGDAKIYYEVYGEGKPVVVLHGGIVGSTMEMGQFIDSLSRNYQVIAVSTRGHGKSEMGSQTPSYERKAEDVNAIINAVTKDSVTVLGFSDGAYTGYFLAAKHPEKVKKLIAIGAGEWKQGFRTFDNSRAVLFSMDSLYFKQQLALMPEPQRFDEWLVTLNKYYNSVNIGKKTFGAIQCPVLVMAGELDQNAPLKTVIAAYEMIPKAQLSIIPNAPHPAFVVNFPAVWASMAPFLKQ
ncbi:alpha/beta fold hydrolase [Pontibacter silvestris]|uniref:Alpha/beta fold hydrolase n=1 Tax=Pontibacter silvestris TaxID=2305183 RepID=A0ABW4WXM9_9BACT|nr:alpha/beta hydrolase [Pontibacter silvestris]MCC9138491.1 alpha/beta hydrolase [Pontibacter silvestris]